MKLRLRGFGVVLICVQAAAFCLVAGCKSIKAPKLPLEKNPVFRTWHYATGSEFDAALEITKDGMVQLLMLDGQRVGVSFDRLSVSDKRYIEEMLLRPRGNLNDVLALSLDGRQPVFSVNASFFPNGKLTESPLVYVQYLFEDKAGRVHHRASEPVRLYKTAGRFDHNKVPRTVVVECKGRLESKYQPASILAIRAVLLLLDGSAEQPVLDVYSNQNCETLKGHGVSIVWWNEPPKSTEE